MSQALRVLIVEDNEDSAQSFQMLLEIDGYETRIANRALEALQLVDEFVPDVAFVDIGLPDISGFDLARRMRSDPRLGQTTLVALTGYGTEEDKQETRRAGFHHHLTKPIEVETVYKLLSTVAAGASILEASVRALT